MDTLKTPNQLLYFTNEELQMTIGFRVDQSSQPIMWYKERDDIITKSKFISTRMDTHFPEYKDTDKLLVKFYEYDSPCLCASISNKYIGIITLNTNTEHKATYKLHLYYDSGKKYDDLGIYYSYFS